MERNCLKKEININISLRDYLRHVLNGDVYVRSHFRRKPQRNK